MDIAEQVACIFTGVRGHLDRIAPADVTEFEAEYLEHIRSTQQPLLNTIRKEGALSKETEAALKDLAIAYVDQYLAAKE